MSRILSSADGIARVESVGAVAILRLRRHQQALAIGRRLLAAGLPIMEVTFDHPEAPRALKSMVEELPEGAVLGAGTIRRVEQVRQCKAVGGTFCVSPHTDTRLIQACLDEGLEPIPGASTATEVASAVDAGARVVKLFPAGPLGVGYLRAMLGPFEEVRFLPTGGIRHNDVAAWLDAGAVAVGLGSDLVPAEPEESELDSIERRAEMVVAQVTKARAQ